MIKKFDYRVIFCDGGDATETVLRQARADGFSFSHLDRELKGWAAVFKKPIEEAVPA
ncbi:MAG: hypothetical protein WAN65_01005 [Candidatus Sulfotelmatobacter sp.]